MENLINIVDGVLANTRFKLAQQKREQGNWYPACGGTETPFHTRTGYRLLYVWQPTTGNHAYLNLDTDMILTDSEAMRALGVF